jgi:hypothetical protein
MGWLMMRARDGTLNGGKFTRQLANATGRSA